MKTNVIIRDTAYYHPETRVGNDHFIEHFKAQGKDITPLLSATGRESRYLSHDPNENTLTMGIEAAKRVLKQAELEADDVDMIVFSSGTPEYVQPTLALKVHHAIGCDENTIVYDMNSNCVGMVVAVEQASRYMLSNHRVKYALVIGSEQLHKYSRINEEVPYANFGDAACAVILERKENTECGFIDSNYFTDSSLHNTVRLPARGMSAMYDEVLSDQDRRLEWLPFTPESAIDRAHHAIGQMLHEHGLAKEEVRKYFISQFSKKSLEVLSELLREDPAKFKFVGDTYGYTGTSSPFLAFAKSIEDHDIKRGDVVVFWSVGAGITSCSLIFRY